MATLSSKVCRKNQGPTLRLCICTLRILPLRHSQSAEPCLSPMGKCDPTKLSAREFVDGRGGVGRGGGECGGDGHGGGGGDDDGGRGGAESGPSSAKHDRDSARRLSVTVSPANYSVTDHWQLSNRYVLLRV